jgi:hypothetical protein
MVVFFSPERAVSIQTRQSQGIPKLSVLVSKSTRDRIFAALQSKPLVLS